MNTVLPMQTTLHGDFAAGSMLALQLYEKGDIRKQWNFFSVRKEKLRHVSIPLGSAFVMADTTAICGMF